jgi:hypothetical protein
MSPLALAAVVGAVVGVGAAVVRLARRRRPSLPTCPTCGHPMEPDLVGRVVGASDRVVLWYCEGCDEAEVRPA